MNYLNIENALKKVTGDIDKYNQTASIFERILNDQNLSNAKKADEISKIIVQGIKYEKWMNYRVKIIPNNSEAEKLIPATFLIDALGDEIEVKRVTKLIWEVNITNEDKKRVDDYFFDNFKELGIIQIEGLKWICR